MKSDAAADDTAATRRIATLGIASLLLYALTWLLESMMVHPGTVPVQSYGATSRITNFILYVGYMLVTVCLMWTYVAVIRMAARGKLKSALARRWAFATPVLVNLLLLCWPPLQSQDAVSYLAHGMLAQLPGGNPLLLPVQAIRDSSLAPLLSVFGWNTWPGVTPYGILWTRLEISIAALCGTHVMFAVLLFKVIAMLASLVTARLIWKVLGQLDPSLQLTGTLFWMWNPLVLVSYAAEGHNDAVMIMLSVAALGALVAHRPGPSLFAQLIGVMTKYYSALFLPAQCLLMWRTVRDRKRLLLETLVVLAVTTALLVLLYGRYWAGMHSFVGISQRPYPFGAVTFVGVVRWMARHGGLELRADAIAQGLAALILLGCIAWYSLRVRVAADFASACAWIALAFALVFSPDYWSWYACMPLAWICLGELRRLQWLAIVLTLCGRLTDPVNDLRLGGFVGWNLSKGLVTGIGALLPLLLLLLWAVGRTPSATTGRLRSSWQ